MKTITRLAAALVALVTVPAYAADQFDLKCVDEGGKPSISLRVDLKAGEWCVDQCVQINNIVSVSSGMIVFEETRPGNEYTRGIEVNRLTGAYTMRFFVVDKWYKVDGTCSPGSFSGLPLAIRKF